MKKVLCVFTLLFLTADSSFELFAQNAKITNGPEEDAGRVDLVALLGDEKTGLYAVMRKTGRFSLGGEYIEKLDENFVATKTFPMEDMEWQKHDMIWSGIRVLDNEITLFYTCNIKGKEEDEIVILTQGLDNETLTLHDETKELYRFKVNRKDRFGSSLSFSSRDNRFYWSGNSGIDVNVSDDSKKVMFSKDYSASRSDEDMETIHYDVYDENMVLVWGNNITLPYPDRKFFISSTFLDNNGNVYLMAREKAVKEKNEKGGKRYTSTRHIFLIASNGEEVKDFSIDLGESAISEAAMVPDPDKGEIIVTGFYSDSNSPSVYSKGIFYMTIDIEKKEVKNVNKQEFDLSFMTESLSERQKEKAEKKASEGKEIEVKTYTISNIIQKEMGGSTIIAEYEDVYVVTSTYTNANGSTSTTTTTHYLNNDIVVIDVDKEGKITWSQHVPKAQHTVNDGGYYSSFVTRIIGDDIHFIYNDDARNLFWKKGDDMVTYRGGGTRDFTIMDVKVDSEGNVTRNSLLKAEKGTPVASPSRSCSLGTNDVVLFCTRKKTHQFLRVSY